MTARERLVAAARGGHIDRAPVVCWSNSPGHLADAIVAPLELLRKALDTHPDQAVLAEVVSPFGRAIRRDLDLSELLREDPDLGAQRLDGFVQETRDEIDAALSQGAFGVFYRLDGAYPIASTPMEYGGHYLELDRQLLAEVEQAPFNLLYVEGEKEPYLDFVCDLPAHAFAWDYEHSGVDLAAARAMRNGALAAPAPGADIALLRSATSVETWLANVAKAPPT